MTPETRIFAALCTAFVAGLALIAWGAGGGKLAGVLVGLALVFAATSLLAGGPRR